MSGSRCIPTFTSLWVGDSMCGCKVFETVLSEAKLPVECRPTNTERTKVIKSGNVFVYQERESGIRRWTDGLHWSPSRISGNFLIYRELPGPSISGHKKEAFKRESTTGDDVDNLAVSKSHNGSDATALIDGDKTVPKTPLKTRHPSRHENRISDKRFAQWFAERSLYGPLTDSYEFKRGGLMKKTMSVQIEGHPYHLVAYYDPKEVMDGTLKDSALNEELVDVCPRPELLYKQTWRAPLGLTGAPQSSLGGLQAYPVATHMGTEALLYQPHHSFPQPGEPFAQFAFNQGQTYHHTIPYDTHVTPPNLHYPIVFQHYHQCAIDMPTATAALLFPSFPQGYLDSSTNSNPSSPSQVHEYCCVSSPLALSEQTIPGYTIVPSQNLGKLEGELCPQYGPECGSLGERRQRQYPLFACMTFLCGPALPQNQYKHERRCL